MDERREMNEEIRDLVKELHDSKPSKPPNPWLLTLVPMLFTTFLYITSAVYYIGQFDILVNNNTNDIADNKITLSTVALSLQEIVKLQSLITSEQKTMKSNAKYEIRLHEQEHKRIKVN